MESRTCWGQSTSTESSGKWFILTQSTGAPSAPGEKSLTNVRNVHLEEENSPRNGVSCTQGFVQHTGQKEGVDLITLLSAKRFVDPGLKCVLSLGLQQLQCVCSPAPIPLQAVTKDKQSWACLWMRLNLLNCHFPAGPNSSAPKATTMSLSRT